MLKKFIRSILSPIASTLFRQEKKNSRNLSLQLQKRALDTSAAYIEEHMIHVASVRGQTSVLTKGISRVEHTGLFCEFGVFKGHTLQTIGTLTTEKIHGFDSFKGLPEFWTDGYGEKAFELPKTPEFSGNVAIHEGYFEDSLPQFLNDHQEDFAFVHVDCDLYSSTQTIFSLAQNRFKEGTVIVFDEYFNYPGWQHGEYKAFQEFIAASHLSYQYITYNAMQGQVAVILTA